MRRWVDSTIWKLGCQSSSLTTNATHPSSIYFLIFLYETMHCFCKVLNWFWCHRTFCSDSRILCSWMQESSPPDGRYIAEKCSYGHESFCQVRPPVNEIFQSCCDNVYQFFTYNFCSRHKNTFYSVVVVCEIGSTSYEFSWRGSIEIWANKL